MYIRILTIVALAICLWSCSSEQDEPFVPESKGIAFGGNNGTWQDAPTSRATSGLETLFNTFRVWGYKTTAADAAGPSSPQLVMDIRWNTPLHLQAQQLPTLQDGNM